MKLRIYKSGTLIADGVELPYTITGLSANTNYDQGTFVITATDGNGNDYGRVELPEFKTLQDNSSNDNDQKGTAKTDEAVADESKVGK